MGGEDGSASRRKKTPAHRQRFTGATGVPGGGQACAGRVWPRNAGGCVPAKTSWVDDELSKLNWRIMLSRSLASEARFLRASTASSAPWALSVASWEMFPADSEISLAAAVCWVAAEAIR